MPKKSPLHLIRKKLTKLEMKKLLKDAIDEPHGVKKGEKFELFFENYMNQQQGFIYIAKHCRSKVGEIDYFYRTEFSNHPLWQKYPYIFIECKNWKEKISSEKMSHFKNLLKAKILFSCCGVYLTTTSFSPQAFTVIRDAKNVEKLFIIPIESTELHNLVDLGFKAFLQGKCDEIMAKA